MSTLAQTPGPDWDRWKVWIVVGPTLVFAASGARVAMVWSEARVAWTLVGALGGIAGGWLVIILVALIHDALAGSLPWE